MSNETEGFWNRFFEYLKKCGIKNIRQFAIESKIPYTTLKSAYDRNVLPGKGTLYDIADFLKTTPDFLKTGRSPLANIELIPEGTYRKIPLLDWTQAGLFSGINASPYPGVADEYIDTDLPGARLFAVRVRGDSMEPRFGEGDLLIINPDLAVEPGDYCIAKRDAEDEATFKQLKRIGETYFLHPLNPRYDDVEMDKRIRIVGRVVMRRREEKL